AHTVSRSSSCLFVFSDMATTVIHTLSLHDALPIYGEHLVNTWREIVARAAADHDSGSWSIAAQAAKGLALAATEGEAAVHEASRSEEHTSELQSRSDLVCRLLLEKKNKQNDRMQGH